MQTFNYYILDKITSLTWHNFERFPDLTSIKMYQVSSEHLMLSHQMKLRIFCPKSVLLMSSDFIANASLPVDYMDNNSIRSYVSEMFLMPLIPQKNPNTCLSLRYVLQQFLRKASMQQFHLKLCLQKAKKNLWATISVYLSFNHKTSI